MELKGKKAFIFGVANERSLAYGVARKYREHGAQLGFSYSSDRVTKRIHPICDQMGGDFVVQCDLTDDAHISRATDAVREHWGGLDILVHSVAYARRDDLQGRYMDTSRAGFQLAMDVSVYSLVALAKAFEPLLNPGASIITMSYLGANRVIPNYNIMGVAKAALEASVRYLAAEAGKNGVRVNAISAGPIKTLAASGIADFKSILGPVEQRSPLQRNITLADVGGAALYLGSDLASGTTGEVLYVDSGYNIMGL